MWQVQDKGLNRWNWTGLSKGAHAQVDGPSVKVNGHNVQFDRSGHMWIVQFVFKRTSSFCCRNGQFSQCRQISETFGPSNWVKNRPILVDMWTVQFFIKKVWFRTVHFQSLGPSNSIPRPSSLTFIQLILWHYKNWTFSAPEKSSAKTFEILTNEGYYCILSAPYRSYQILVRLNAVCIIAFLSEWSFLSKHRKKNRHHNFSTNKLYNINSEIQ